MVERTRLFITLYVHCMSCCNALKKEHVSCKLDGMSSTFKFYADKIRKDCWKIMHCEVWGSHVILMIEITILWEVTPCSLVKRCQRVGGT